MKVCNRCNTEKEITHFVKCVTSRDGITNACYECLFGTNRQGKPITTKTFKRATVVKKRRKFKSQKQVPIIRISDRITIRSNRDRTLSRYGLTEETFILMLDAQGGMCAIDGCFSTENLCVDHDHSTGEIRKILCRPCNSALGFLKEDVKRIEGLKNYIKEYAEVKR